MPDAGQDDEPDPLIAAAVWRAAWGEQRIRPAVQDQGRHADLGHPAAVPFRASLTALCGSVADPADLVPLGHPAHLVLVDGIVR